MNNGYSYNLQMSLLQTLSNGTWKKLKALTAARFYPTYL